VTPSRGAHTAGSEAPRSSPVLADRVTSTACMVPLESQQPVQSQPKKRSCVHCSGSTPCGGFFSSWHVRPRHCRRHAGACSEGATQWYCTSVARQPTLVSSQRRSVCEPVAQGSSKYAFSHWSWGTSEHQIQPPPRCSESDELCMASAPLQLCMGRMLIKVHAKAHTLSSPHEHIASRPRRVI
jgi:hypothetical protein